MIFMNFGAKTRQDINKWQGGRWFGSQWSQGWPQAPGYWSAQPS